MTITTDTTLLHDPRRQAALLYWQGFSVPQIAAMLQMKRPTVQSWKQRDGWDSVAPISRVEMSLEARLTQLIIKPQKTGGDFKEIDLLGRQIERLARVNRYSQTGNEADLNPNVANRNKGGRRKPKKNFFSDEAIEKLEQIFFEQSFEYQLHWYRAGLEHRIRDILKSRQIGATFYFSREALLRALKTGHNQIFLSASKTQAYVFREYIIAFARLVDVDLNHLTLYRRPPPDFSEVVMMTLIIPRKEAPVSGEGTVVIPQPAGDEPVIKNTFFFPDIDPKRVRERMRLEQTVAPARLREAIKSGMAETNAELYEYREQKIAAGFTRLADVPADDIDGESIKVFYYERAVCAMATASLYERYRGVDASAKGDKKADSIDSTIDELWRDMRWAVARIQDKPRCIVSQI